MLRGFSFVRLRGSGSNGPLASLRRWAWAQWGSRQIATHLRHDELRLVADGPFSTLRCAYPTSKLNPLFLAYLYKSYETSMYARPRCRAGRDNSNKDDNRGNDDYMILNTQCFLPFCLAQRA
eukprot:COSAG02_NODE_29272_length_572_cov_1.737844_1_plen_121_part_10